MKRRRPEIKYSRTAVVAEPSYEPATAVSNPVAIADGHDQLRYAAGILTLVLGAWAYWPTICELVFAWERQPDYSHGFLVLPFALFLLWNFRSSFPGAEAKGWWIGLGLLLLSQAMRIVSAIYFLETVDQISLIVWLASVVCMIFGSRVLWWSSSALAFLIFMVPLPYRVERMLGGPLRTIATEVSCYGLQILGQPAIAEGQTILLGDQQLEVAQACSGLRLFMSIIAMAFAYIVLMDRQSWVEKIFLVVCIVPIALFSNASRIVVTGLLYQYTTSNFAHGFSHDFAGFAMIAFSAFLFWAAIWYFRKLMPREEPTDIGRLVQYNTT